MKVKIETSANVKKLFLSTVFLLFIGNVFSQTNTIRGSVYDEENVPIVGAIVSISSSTIGTITDLDGHFEIQTKQLPLSLDIRFLGYKDKTVEVQNYTDPIDIILNQDVQALEEVVVVGYGTQSKKNVASAISTVKNNDFKDVPAVSVDGVLQGRVTGLSVTTPSGSVGQAPVVRIRGVNSITSGTSPLYVVDGIPISSSNPAYSGDINILSDINPDDIESVDVLKDAAAAAVYGSRAANGVVLITTKRGKVGNRK